MESARMMSMADALLLAMRRGEEQHIRDLMVAASAASGCCRGRVLEECLDEAWRTACALNLPLSVDMKMRVVHTLVVLRYYLADPTSDVPPAADAQVRWRELWCRVDMLLEYSRRLQDDLERFQSDRVPGSADKSVLLARMCALAVHSVKAAFLATYDKVPWEEMEYLLVMFIEAHTVYATLAHLVATARSTAAHLRCFRERLEKYVLAHRAEPDPEAAMKRLKKEPREGRAASLNGVVVDSALAELRKDFSLLRDWHSLKEIHEVLDVTSEVLLSLEDDAWESWGWLALRWALFVVGERVKYSWLSPNLSPRWAFLVEAMAPGGVLKIIAAIRDYQEHGEEGSNAKTLALSDMKKSERKNLAEELEKMRNAAFTALFELESEVLQIGTENKELAAGDVDSKSCKAVSEMVCCNYIDSLDGRRILSAIANDAACSKDLIIDEVIKSLEPAKHKSTEEFEEIERWGSELKAFRKTHTIPTQSLRPLKLTKLINSKFYNIKRMELLFYSLPMQFASKHIPEVFPRVRRLLRSSSTEHIQSFQADLSQASPKAENIPTNKVMNFIDVILNARKEAGNPIHGVNFYHWSDFALRGALRELASRWHEDDKVVPMTVPFSLALFGRQLRNYLNHFDEIFIPPFDLRNLACLLRSLARSPLKINRARPRLRDLRWSQVENERLLRVVELKSYMFRYAREGELGELQRLFKDGHDVGVRDCQDRTLLHAAAQTGQDLVVRWLLGLGTELLDPLAEDWWGHTALHVAGTAAVAEALVDVCSVQWGREGGLTSRLHALHSAALGGRADVVAVLLRDSRGIDVEHAGETPLHMAAKGGHDQVVLQLLAAGARYKDGGATPLQLAADSGSGAAVRLLLGATPSPTDEDCWEATRRAASWGHEEASFILLDELERRGPLVWSPQVERVLDAVGQGGSCAIALRLLDCWPGTLGESARHTPLLSAAIGDHAELVRALIARGADPLSKKAGFCSAIECAARADSLYTIDAVVQLSGGGCNLRTALLEALHGAASCGQLEAVKRLVHHGADVDAVDSTGWTPLAAASHAGSAEVVAWLLQRVSGGRPDEESLRCALMSGQLNVVKVLLPPLRCSALNLAVRAGRKGVLERILRQFVTHLRPLSSRDCSTPDFRPSSRRDRRREEIENKAVLQWKAKDEEDRLHLLQRTDQKVRSLTLLHLATGGSALPVVEYLLDQEDGLLRRVYSKCKNTALPSLDGITVYALDALKRTALGLGVNKLCAPSVAEALLKRMGDKVWMALGHRNLQEVRVMAVEAMRLADSAYMADNGRLVRAICGWVSSKGEGLLGGEGLQDIRRRAVAALCSGQDEVWGYVVAMQHRHCFARWFNKEGGLFERTIRSFMELSGEEWKMSDFDLWKISSGLDKWLVELRLEALDHMAACLQQGVRGEMAVQLLCQWLCDLSENTLPEVVERRMACEALRIAVMTGNRAAVTEMLPFLRDEWRKSYRSVADDRLPFSTKVLFMLFVVSQAM